jgi:hypothetical protein
VYHAWPLDQSIESVASAGDSTAIVIADRGLAPMPVYVAITREGGAVQRVELPVDPWLAGDRRQTLRVTSSPAVTRVEIDPDARLPDIERRNQVWTSNR